MSQINNLKHFEQTASQLYGYTPQNISRNNAENTEKNNNAKLVQLSNNSAKIQRHERELLVDGEIQQLIVKIVNSDTKELIRQIPTEDAVNLSKKLQDMINLMFG